MKCIIPECSHIIICKFGNSIGGIFDKSMSDLFSCLREDPLTELPKFPLTEFPNLQVQQIEVHLSTAHVILLLISASFLASKHCSGQEMSQAIQRHERREARVIPVLLRPVVFTHFPFAALRPLPTNEKPVVSWRDRDSAFVDVALGIERVVYLLMLEAVAEESGEETIAEEIAEEAEAEAEAIAEEEAEIEEAEQKRIYYENTLKAYARALQQDSADATAYQGKGNALVGLGRLDEALSAYAQSIALMSLPTTYATMGDVLTELGRSDEAVAAYRQALALDSSSASASFGLSKAFLQAGRVQEAEQAYEQAKRFGDDD